jgi:hypothetical protein
MMAVADSALNTWAIVISGVAIVASIASAILAWRNR